MLTETMIATKEIKEGIQILIFVQPKASRGQFGPVHGDRIKVYVTSAPVDGKANQSVIALLAKVFSVPKSSVTVTHGLQSRRKTVVVSGITTKQVKAAL